jgi:hypothetical protein
MDWIHLAQVRCQWLAFYYDIFHNHQYLDPYADEL